MKHILKKFGGIIDRVRNDIDALKEFRGAASTNPYHFS
ncbi:uncharacterized protein METZ01_LOCUS377882 [marine metagenome]|uniref:Uncharacterized protein n=1 Tax=marine metagenome TaxID=408172 RepID=A0A382TU84_9ZZZZ